MTLHTCLCFDISRTRTRCTSRHAFPASATKDPHDSCDANEHVDHCFDFRHRAQEHIDHIPIGHAANEHPHPDQTPVYTADYEQDLHDLGRSTTTPPTVTTRIHHIFL